MTGDGNLDIPLLPLLELLLLLEPNRTAIYKVVILVFGFFYHNVHDGVVVLLTNGTCSAVDDAQLMLEEYESLQFEFDVLLGHL